MKTQCSFGSKRTEQAGFSLLEMMLATMILLVGLVAIAQLVPASILLNSHNRSDSTALVFAQRELDQMLDQPMNAPGNQFTDALGNVCKLGNPATPNTVQGTNVLQINNATAIDFTSSVSGYNFTFTDPTDPTGATYDVRWAVIISSAGGKAYSKRFILGIRQLGGNGYFQPITLDTLAGR